MENSSIEWTHHTFNPWRGCTKVSAGCDHCYAEAGSHRNPKVLGEWGPIANRVVAAEPYWKQPLRWNRDAAGQGTRHRVFCASLADVFEDRDDLIPHRTRLLKTIALTQHLDWLLLTKRPHRINDLLLKSGFNTTAFTEERFKNVWLGTSIENQATAQFRLPELIAVQARLRFLSMEPLLGPVNLKSWLNWKECTCKGEYSPCEYCNAHGPRMDINWVIIGGESGADSRPCHLNWIEGIVEQCYEAECPVFVKQLGANPQASDDEYGRFLMNLTDHKNGGDITEFPPNLQKREFPR
jgi:protein gp37